MQKNWRKNWRHNLLLTRRLLLIGLLATGWGLLNPVLAIASDFDQVIKSFERDFNRVDPLTMLDRYQAVVQSVTGMVIDKAVVISHQSRGDVKQAAYTDGMHQLNMADERNLSGFEYLLKQLRLLETDYNLKDVFIDSYFDKIYGFYRPKDKQLIIMQGVSSTIATGILFHELVHAAQDHTVNLTRFQEQHFRTLDSALAAKSLLEGQATSLRVIIQVEQNVQDKTPREILTTVIESMDQELSEQTFEAADFVTRLQTFPYINGMKFVLKRYVNDEQTFTAMLNKIPSSTEQVLHMNKFYSDERPKVTTLERKADEIASAKGILSLYETTLGEFFIKEMFAAFDSEEKPSGKKAANGWGGDRVLVLKSKGKKFYIWDTEWDTREDADQFYQCFQDYTMERLNTRKRRKDKAFDAIFSKNTETVRIKREAQRVLIIEGELTSKILSTILSFLNK